MTYTKMKNKEILEKIEEWWQDELTCAGEPTCTIKECDLCYACYGRLKHKFEDKDEKQ